MRRTLWIGTMFSAAAFAGQTMNVAVCNVGQIPAAKVEHAEAEAAYVFQGMDIEIRWMECDAADKGVRPDFIVRVQMGGKAVKAGPVSLEAMGRAFMDEKGYGFMADAYFGAIRDLTVTYPFASGDQLLGYVISHELGHLLIGAGHRPNGIMRASLGKSELEELNRRHLKFNEWEQGMIRKSLAARKAK